MTNIVKTNNQQLRLAQLSVGLLSTLRIAFPMVPQSATNVEVIVTSGDTHNAYAATFDSTKGWWLCDIDASQFPTVGRQKYEVAYKIAGDQFWDGQGWIEIVKATTSGITPAPLPDPYRYVVVTVNGYGATEADGAVRIPKLNIGTEDPSETTGYIEGDQYFNRTSGAQWVLCSVTGTLTWVKCASDVISVNGKVGAVSLGANDVGAYTKEETDATVSRLDADIADASSAAAAALTKAENAQSEANAAQSAANVAQSSANEAHRAASVASDKADAVNAALANKLDKTAVVAPSASATAGQAADAKAVHDALGGKLDKSGGTIGGEIVAEGHAGQAVFYDGGLNATNYDGINTDYKGNAIVHGGEELLFPQVGGTLARKEDIEDAVKNKVGSFESVGGASATVENGVAKLSDFFTESNSLLTETIDARLPYPLYAVPSTGIIKDRAINTTSLASVTVPDNFTDLLIRASVASSLSVTMPAAIATKYGDTFPAEAGEYLITITKTGAAEAYVRTIKLEVANA